MYRQFGPTPNSAATHDAVQNFRRRILRELKKIKLAWPSLNYTTAPKAHSEAVRGIESKAGEFYRAGLKGSEKRAREAARSDGFLLSYGSRPVDRYRINELKHSVSEERLEQVREIDGELAYEKMRRAVEKASQEKASQEKARQVERARLEWDRQETARQSRERRGPERGGPERDFGPSR